MSEKKEGGSRAEEARKQFGAVRELSKDEETIETLKQIHTELELDLEVSLRNVCSQMGIENEMKKYPKD